MNESPIERILHHRDCVRIRLIVTLRNVGSGRCHSSSPLFYAPGDRPANARTARTNSSKRLRWTSCGTPGRSSTVPPAGRYRSTSARSSFGSDPPHSGSAARRRTGAVTPASRGRSGPDAAPSLTTLAEISGSARRRPLFSLRRRERPGRRRLPRLRTARLPSPTRRPVRTSPSCPGARATCSRSSTASSTTLPPSMIRFCHAVGRADTHRRPDVLRRSGGGGQGTQGPRHLEGVGRLQPPVARRLTPSDRSPQGPLARRPSCGGWHAYVSRATVDLGRRVDGGAVRYVRVQVCGAHSALTELEVSE